MTKTSARYIVNPEFLDDFHHATHSGHMETGQDIILQMHTYTTQMGGIKCTLAAAERTCTL